MTERSSGDESPARFRTLSRLLDDERAIEGLPIRLVIALVVGVASLGVMMQMLSGVSGLAATELDTQPSPEVTTPDNGSVDVRVVTPEGRPVAGATVVAKAGTARLDGIVTNETDADGTATFDLKLSLGPNQVDGTVRFEVKPPAGSEFVDRRANTKLLVVAEK